MVAALLAGGVAAGLLSLADRWRDGDLHLFAVLAALGSTAFVALATNELGTSTGTDGRFLLWVVLVVSLPVALATLLWMPHPALGVNVALAALVVVVASPLGDDGASVAAGKALVLALLLAAAAALVDLRTRSRAGSLLHYSAIAALGVSKVILGYELDASLAALLLAALGVGELGMSLLLRRRTWALSGWLTVAVAVLAASGSTVLDAFVAGVLAVLVAAPLVAAAVVLQRDGELVRSLVLGALPPGVAAAFPP